MSNLTIGGVDPRSRQPFTYYETRPEGWARGRGSMASPACDAHDQLAQHAH